MNSITENYLSYLDIVDMNDNQLQEHVVNLIIESKISVSKMETSFKKNLKAAESFLKDHKVDIGYVKSQAKKAGEYMRTQHKKGVSADKASKAIIDSVGKKTLSKCIAQIKKYADSKNIPISEKVIRSLCIFIVLLFINTLMLSLTGPIIGTLFGAQSAMIFGVVVLAPIFEEYAKRYALLGNYPFVYTGIFAGIEALMYISMMVSNGIPMATALILRAAVLTMHFSTTIIQKFFHDKAIESGEEELSLTGYYLGVAAHSLWNMMAVVAATK
jgi:hypothetical protein